MMTSILQIVLGMRQFCAASSVKRAWTISRIRPRHAVLLIACCAVLAAGAQRVDAMTVNFQGTSVSEDVTLISGFSNDNFGGTSNLDVGTTSGIRRGLLRFPTLGTTLAGETVTGASLQLGLELATIGTFTNQTIFVHLVTPANVGWVEGNNASIAAAPDTGLSTWSERLEGSTAWAGSAGMSTAGTDYVTTAVGSFTASSTDPLSTIYTVNFSDVTFLQNWIDNPSQNTGFLLRSPGLESLSALLRISSSEGGTPPLLSVETLQVPEPGTGMLLWLAAMGQVVYRRRRRRPLRSA